jgi:hypothetical protein
MPKVGILTIATVAALASPVWPGQIEGPPGTPQDLIRQADVILHVRADGPSDEPGKDTAGALGASPTQVRFTVLSVLKGSFASESLQFNGHLDARDDRNDESVPYRFIRPGGRKGNCFALGYRQGGQYLLMMRRTGHRAYAQPNDLTPYWMPLRPTNEQVLGSDDPWVRWVVEAIKRSAPTR